MTNQTTPDAAGDQIVEPGSEPDRSVGQASPATPAPQWAAPVADAQAVSYQATPPQPVSYQAAPPQPVYYQPAQPQAAYAAPVPYGAAPTSLPAGRRTLGVVAFLASLVALVGGMTISGFVALGLSSYVGPAVDGSLDTFSGAQESDMLAISNGMIAVFLFGSALGVWAIAQGIVAIVRRRGRAFGIAAIAVAVMAPIACYVVFNIVLIASSPLLAQPYPA